MFNRASPTLSLTDQKAIAYTPGLKRAPGHSPALSCSISWSIPDIKNKTQKKQKNVQIYVL